MIFEISRTAIFRFIFLTGTLVALAAASYFIYIYGTAQNSPIVITVIATSVSIISAFIAFRQQRLSQNVLPLGSSAKLWDRQNDLDKILINNPSVFREFMTRSRLPDAYFYAKETPRNDLYYQLKGLTYLHLNFFEEIYLATISSPSVELQFEGQKWQSFMFMKMRHSLLKEIFINEQGSTYTGQFVDFLNQNRNEWDLPTYSRESGGDSQHQALLSNRNSSGIEQFEVVSNGEA